MSSILYHTQLLDTSKLLYMTFVIQFFSNCTHLTPVTCRIRYDHMKLSCSVSREKFCPMALELFKNIAHVLVLDTILVG